MDEDFVGATKVKDGLFIGDQFAGQDLEFVVANKVTHIVNCAGSTLPSHWEPIGVQYLTYAWQDNEEQQILDPCDSVLHAVFTFIESAMSEGESALILSEKGVGRCCLVACGYLMTRYRWGAGKAQEFMRNRQQEMKLNAGFCRQLQALEGRLSRAGVGPKTRTWTETCEEDEEEVIVANTYLNSQTLGLADYQTPMAGVKNNKLHWTDGEQGDARLLENVTQSCFQVPIDKGCLVLKSCMKHSASREVRIPLSVKQRSSRVFAPSDYANQVSTKSPMQSVLEYGKLDGPRSKKTVPRPLSASKRENSPLTAMSRPQSAKRESPMRTVPDKKRPSPREKESGAPPSTLLGSKLRRTTTPQRLRTVPADLPKGPIKAMSASAMKKAVWK